MLLHALMLLAARDVAVIDVGGGPRIVDVRAAIARLDPNLTVIAQSDAQGLYDAYGKDCSSTDADCWQKAALAASVQAIVLVPDGDRLFFVEGGVVRSESDAKGLDTAVERGLFRDRFGVVVVQGAPVAAIVVVDDLELPKDGLLRAGPHTVHIEANGFVTKDVVVTVKGGGSLDVDGRLDAQLAPPPPPMSLRWVWPAVSGGVVVVGLGVALACEGVAGGIVADAEAGKGADVATLRAVEGVEIASFVVAGIAAASAIVGASVVLSDEGA